MSPPERSTPCQRIERDPWANLNVNQLVMQVESDDLGHMHRLYQDLEHVYDLLKHRNADGFYDVWQNFLAGLNKEIKAHPGSDAAKMLQGFDLAGTDHEGHFIYKDRNNHRQEVERKLQQKYEPSPDKTGSGSSGEYPESPSPNPRP